MGGEPLAKRWDLAAIEDGVFEYMHLLTLQLGVGRPHLGRLEVAAVYN